MSLLDLTRNCFQGGIPAQKWAALCKLYLSKNTDLETPELELSNSVLVLFSWYTSHPGLQRYLQHAVKTGLLPLPIYVDSVLQHLMHSAESQNLATIDCLCSIAVSAHYASGLSALASLVSPNAENASASTASKVLDALTLLKTSHNLAGSQVHSALESCSQLLVLLLSCVMDMSQIPSNQAMLLFAEASEVLQDYRLLSDVRQILEPFVLSLSILIGNDTKAAREAQAMHTMQLALGRTDLHGSTADSDLVTFSLTLQHLVFFESANACSPVRMDPVALFLAISRWTAWFPSAFYTQVLLSALSCLSQSTKSHASIWRVFILGRLPSIIVAFEQTLKSENTSDADWANALQVALMSIARRTELLRLCDQAVWSYTPASSGTQVPSSVFREFLQQLLQYNLIDQTVAVSMDPLVSNSPSVTVIAEAQDAGLDLRGYLEGQLQLDASSQESSSWLERVWLDPSSHHEFSQLLQSRFATFSTTFDTEGIGQLCKLMYTHDIPLLIMSIHSGLSHLIFHSLSVLAQFNWETAGDPQSAFSQLGDVILFVQATLSKFHITKTHFTHGDATHSTAFLKLASLGAPTGVHDEEHKTAFTSWLKALFDPSSEGIDDTLLRSTQPAVLLAITPMIIENAIHLFKSKQMDLEALNNGISFFTGPLLNWTLVGVIRYLIREIQRKMVAMQVHLHVLYTLLSSTSCPIPVIRVCGAEIQGFFHHSGSLPSDTPVAVARRKEVSQKLSTALPSFQWDSPPDNSWREQPKSSIRAALTMARAGKAPILNIARCLAIAQPAELLGLLWAELLHATSVGELESCRRIVVMVMVFPTAGPPLLPIFLNRVLPGVLSSAAHKAAEQAVTIELAVSLVSSALSCLLQFERAFRSLHGESRPILGESSVSLARRFASFLKSSRRSGNTVCASVAQRLEASKPFTANFPLFVSDMGSKD